MSFARDSSFPPGADRVAEAYAALEGRLRRVIDRAASRVCPGCPSPCCRFWYCREVALNPWYAFVNRAAGSFRTPRDWSRRRDPFGLGAGGCAIRSGRYVFCYSYNCRRLLASLPSPAERAAFEELSGLLLPVNRLPGGRLLSELRDPEDLSETDLGEMGRTLADAFRRLAELELLLPGYVDPTLPDQGPQGDPRSAEP